MAGTLSALISIGLGTVAPMSGSGSLTATMIQGLLSNAAFTGAGSLNAQMLERYFSTGSLTSSGALTAPSYEKYFSSAGLAGNGALSLAMYALMASLGPLGGAGSLTASAVVSAPAGPTFVSSASAVSNTVAMPTHAAGDLILCFTYIKSAAALTTPAGWNAPNVNFLGTTGRAKIGWKVAQSSSETTGTWTGAQEIGILVYRKDPSQEWWFGQPANFSHPITAPPGITNSEGYGFSATTATTTTITYPDVPLNWPQGKFWAVRFAGSTSATNMITNTPSGWTRRSGDASGVSMMDTNGVISTDVNSFGGNTQTVSPTTQWIGISMLVGVV